ncbi:hypothetical protein E1A91_D05G423000v1 [Gossypium mustelinum]|uniref:NB-ARC domain-containing protein n=1 Tax=Gossypium mustelinum TaxID=34275 RepID=A0A5D2V794_GOSMU|nr:hypothetical protein E1A91_D05G423000v1 [Gossypium mustelinum]
MEQNKHGQDIVLPELGSQIANLQGQFEVVAEEEMKFDKLKWLSLEELPGLSHFCPKGYRSVFPTMIELKVRNCPLYTKELLKRVEQ